MSQFVPPLPFDGARIHPALNFTHGLTGDTSVLTCLGEKDVGALTSSDRIITRDFGALRLSSVAYRPAQATSEMVHIPAHSFGAGRPARDTYVLPNQPIVLAGWRARALYDRTQVRVAADRLVDGQIITKRTTTPGALFALHFDRPALIFANGMEIVSAGRCTVAQ